ncbi:hypothetical protein SAMN02910369_00631 [Lachnospiraceae bacterium NE2001]|nr:hypothetical protein SAMN02910369_00631 [Lachnospiraceae bacterium NE2001]
MNEQKKTPMGLVIGIIIGVTVLILGGVGFAIAYVNGAFKSKDDQGRPDRTTESTETANAPTTETTEENTTQDQAEGGTDTADGTSDGTTGGAADEDTLKAAREAYLNILAEHMGKIQLYNWQYGYNYGNTEPIAIEDLNGDDIPELIFMEAEDDIAAGFTIYSYADGKAKCLFNCTTIDAEVAGGSVFYIAKLEDHAGIFIYYCVVDEGSNENFEEITLNSAGIYETNGRFSREAYPKDDHSGMNVTYYEGDVEIAEDEFNDYVNGCEDRIEKFLMHSEGEDIDTLVTMNGCCSISFADAKEELSEGLDVDLDEMFKVTLPIDESMEFCFASGAGGWGTYMTVDADGSFSGNYHDSEMGDSGPDYPNGSVYVCNFSGRFTDIEMVDDHTYKMKLESYTTEESDEPQTIEDGVRYVYANPYGITEGKTFYFYTPGKWIYELPEEFISWSNGVVGDISKDTTLSYYGIYNEDEGLGFFSSP